MLYEVITVGGINSFRSTNGGATWTQLTNGYPSALQFMHVDQHAIAFDPADPSIMYFGNDGGMYKTTNGGRITSYNVCYTKLLRAPHVGMVQVEPGAFHRGAVLLVEHRLDIGPEERPDDLGDVRREDILQGDGGRGTDAALADYADDPS